MKVLRYLGAFLILTFCGCHYFEPRDRSLENQINEMPDVNTLKGKWNATEATYDLLKEKKYPFDSVNLELGKNSMFTIINLPDCITTPFGDPRKGKLLNVKGKWYVYKFGKEWKVQLTFDEDEHFEKKTFLDLKLVLVDSKFKVWEYVGDPDGADILEFEKAD